MMSGNDNGKKDQLPPPQEGEKGVSQAEAQAENEAMVQQDEVLPEAVWTGYGRYSTVHG